MSRSTIWDADTRRLVIQKASKLRDEGLSYYKIGRLLDVPENTIRHWMTGGLTVGERGVQNRLSDDERKERRRESSRRYYRRLRERDPERYRQRNRECARRDRMKARGEYHPVYNPDPQLHSLENLYFPVADVTGLVEEFWTRDSVYRILGRGMEATYRRWTNGEREYARFTAVDRVLTALDLTTSMIPVEPRVGLPEEVRVGQV